MAVFDYAKYTHHICYNFSRSSIVTIRKAHHMTSASAVFQRIHRAVTLLGYAIGHVLSGCPDSARTILNATWDDLKDSLVGRIEHLATTAFIYAVNGNVRYAEQILGQTLDELNRSWNNLPHDVRDWVWDQCLLTMERLPYAAVITRHINNAYAYSYEGNFAEAFYQLTLADDVLKFHRRLVHPATARSAQTAWMEILERVLSDERQTTLAHVRGFVARAGSLVYA